MLRRKRTHISGAVLRTCFLFNLNEGAVPDIIADVLLVDQDLGEQSPLVHGRLRSVITPPELRVVCYFRLATSVDYEGFINPTYGFNFSAWTGKPGSLDLFGCFCAGLGQAAPWPRPPGLRAGRRRPNPAAPPLSVAQFNEAALSR